MRWTCPPEGTDTDAGEDRVRYALEPEFVHDLEVVAENWMQTCIWKKQEEQENKKLEERVEDEV